MVESIMILSGLSKYKAIGLGSRAILSLIINQYTY